jgi:hypothetical protein
MWRIIDDFWDNWSNFPPQDSLEIHLTPRGLGIEGVCKARYLWAKEDVGEFTNELSMYVKKQGSRLLKISEIK